MQRRSDAPIGTKRIVSGNSDSLQWTGRFQRQGVYKFNQGDFQEIPGGILRKIQYMFALLQPPSESWNTHNMGISALPSRVGIWGSVISSPHGSGAEPRPKTGFVASGTRKNTSDGDKFHIFATNIYPYFYDWKPMQSIFDILHKKFQEDQLNSRRFPRFPGVADTLKV